MRDIADIKSDLQEIARMAYDVANKKGKSGGNGNIGIIGGHVVKFNTHGGERGGVVTDEQRRSSEQLRLKLLDLMQEVEEHCCQKDPNAQASKAMKSRIEKIRASLGLTGGQEIASQSLLTRKVVAKAIDRLVEELNVGRTKNERINISSFGAGQAPETLAHPNFAAVRSVAAVKTAVSAALTRAKESLLACCEKFGVPTEDVSANLEKTEAGFSEAMNRLSKQIMAGKVKGTAVAEEVDRLVTAFYETAFPKSQRGTGTIDLSGGRQSIEYQVEEDLNECKRDLSASMVRELLALSDEMRKVRNEVAVEIPRQTDPVKEKTA